MMSRLSEQVNAPIQTLATYFLNEKKLPLVIEPIEKMTLEEWIESFSYIEPFLKTNLLRYGALLFRNFPVKDSQDFSKFIRGLKTGDFFDYIGGDSPRKKVSDGVFTSTEAPPYIKIPLHNELSYIKKFPSHIYFFCETPPNAQGETIIADARKVFERIDPSIKEELHEKKIKYFASYHTGKGLIPLLIPSHRSWKDVFESHDKKIVEKRCRESGYQFKWHPKDWLEIYQTGPAYIEHPDTHEQVWFNQAHIYDLSPRFIGNLRYLAIKLIYHKPYTQLHQVSFGTDEEIPQEYFSHIMDVLDQETIYFHWQKGDVLLLDNLLTMHGRATFKGPRRVLVSMTR